MTAGLHLDTPKEIGHSGFFVLRTPLKSFDELLRWGQSLQTAQLWRAGARGRELTAAWQADVQMLRSRLSAILEHGDVRQAIFIASPSLESALTHWRTAPDSRKGRKVESAVVRYFERMAARPTPFGLFSGCSVGHIVQGAGIRSELALVGSPEYRRTSRLDFDYLSDLCARFRQQPDILAVSRYWRNPTLQEFGDVLHYVESRQTTTGRTNHLVRLDVDEFLLSALERAASGAQIDELVDTVLARDRNGECTREEASSYVAQLVDNQVLVSSLSPTVTGAPPLDDLIDQLEGLGPGSQAAQALRHARSALLSIDNVWSEHSPASYRSIATHLETNLPARLELSHLFQVDMTKPVERAVISDEVIEEIRRGVTVLTLLNNRGENEGLRQFADAFVTRYERAWVPLNRVIDEEVGIGFGAQAVRSHSPQPEPGELQAVLLRKYGECRAEGSNTLTLTDDDLPPARTDGATCPQAFGVICALAAQSSEALARGEFQVVLRGGFGPNGATLLARFCHTDRDLERAVRGHLRSEEEACPNAVFPEVVYLPEGRIGNVLYRPLLREYEIPVLGRSGATPDRQLPLSDLLVTVDESGTILLYSRRLRARVLPRITNAHGYANPRLPAVYRFLANLQHQGAGSGGFGFSWGSLESLDTLPRVVFGRVILAVARWRLTAQETKAITKESSPGAFEEIQRLREHRGLPRWITYSESDNVLSVDLDNPLSVDAFVQLLPSEGPVQLAEMYPSPDELCVVGPEGRFTHELVVPCLWTRPPSERVARAADAALSRAEARVSYSSRTRPPGTEWLYLKLYGGVSALDAFLRRELPALVQGARSAGLLTRWFFLRYADPDDHLRIRFQGSPERLVAEFLPLAAETYGAAIRNGSLWKVEIGTYEREIERYGGIEGVQVAEEIFHADSEAATEALRVLDEKDLSNDYTPWIVAALGVDMLLSDFAVDLAGRLELTRSLWKATLPEVGLNRNAKKALAAKYREDRPGVEAVLSRCPTNGIPVEEVARAFDRRSVVVTEAAQRLRVLAERGPLRPISELIGSYLHMHVNRMLRSRQRDQEAALYDALSRIYASRAARAEAPPSRSDEPDRGMRISERGQS